MAELRLQSDMLNNMSLAQLRAMMQRGAILRNQRDWLNYVQARDGGAFQGGYYSDVVPRGGTNLYQKYYAAMQARQLAFQRARFLNAQRFQNDYMLQQQKFMLGQIAEEQEVARTRQERERKLAAIRKQQDAIRNNPEVDQNSFETQNMLKQLDAAAFQVETEIGLNPVDIQKIPSGNVDKDNNPIETWIVYENGKPVVIRDGDKVAAQQPEKDKFEQAKIDAARKANHDEAVLEETRFNNRTARLKERNTQAANERKASGAVDSTEMYKEKMKIRDEIRKERTEANKLAKAEEWKKWTEANPDATDDEKQQAKINIALENELNDDVEVQEINDRYDRRQLLREPELTPEQGKTTVQYEQPGDSMYQEEMPDEQFAGTEPAGLYDPTGQPLPMDGGMYNGLA